MKTKLTEEQKKANKEARQQAKKEAAEIARIESEKNQPEVKSITITIEWKKSRTWGANPHAKAEVHFKDGNSGPWKTGFLRADGFTCSGCGYDKESTVIAEIFNRFLKYKLYRELIPVDTWLNGEKGKLPYGIYTGNWRSFAGGIGTDCYYSIAQAIGGKFDHVASGKTFDVYKYTDNGTV